LERIFLLSAILGILAILAAFWRWLFRLARQSHGTWQKERRRRPTRMYSSFNIRREHTNVPSRTLNPIDLPERYPDAVAHGSYAEGRLAMYRHEGLRTVKHPQRGDSLA
jgi:hypothetical protein